MKSFLILTLITLSNISLGQSLKPDFQCEALTSDGSSYEIAISNYDFAREVVVKKGNKSCQFAITSGTYSERSVAPQLLVDFEGKESCSLSKSVQLLDKGFLKISDVKGKASAYVLILVGENSLKCDVKHYNKKKLVSRINSSL